MATASDLVPLKNGPIVPASVCLWLADAEDRGLRFRAEPNGRLHVGPRDRVRPDDLDYIRQHRASVLTIVSYLDAVSPC